MVKHRLCKNESYQIPYVILLSKMYRGVRSTGITTHALRIFCIDTLSVCSVFYGRHDLYLWRKQLQTLDIR